MIKDEVLNGMRQLSQDDLKSVLAAGISLVRNPENGIGTDLFESLFELVPQPCVELMPVDNIALPSRLLLHRRPANVLTHPGRTALLGTYIRRGETNLDAIKRCVKRELGPELDVSAIRFSHHYNRPQGCAGEPFADGKTRHTVGLIHLVDALGVNEDDNRKWTSAIPPDLLLGHQEFVKQALGFKKTDTPLFG